MVKLSAVVTFVVVLLDSPSDEELEAGVEVLSDVEIDASSPTSVLLASFWEASMIGSVELSTSVDSLTVVFSVTVESVTFVHEASLLWVSFYVSSAISMPAMSDSGVDEELSSVYVSFTATSLSATTTTSAGVVLLVESSLLSF